MEWLNQPPEWQSSTDGKTVRLRAGAQTDFWRKTYDGGLRDNGHFYYQQVTGDFTAEVRVTGQYAALYDQAGLMVREDALTWLKCGIEFLHGVQQASVVVTHDWSDWSVMPLANPAAIQLRVVRQGATVEVYAAPPGQELVLLRQTYLSATPSVAVGLMAAAPTGEGFPVTFEEWQIRQP